MCVNQKRYRCTSEQRTGIRKDAIGSHIAELGHFESEYLWFLIAKSYTEFCKNKEGTKKELNRIRTTSTIRTLWKRWSKKLSNTIEHLIRMTDI